MDEILMELQRVDSLYCFLDFQDEPIVRALIQKFTNHKVRLCLVSDDRKPVKALRDYAKESGSSFREKRVR